MSIVFILLVLGSEHQDSNGKTVIFLADTQHLSTGFKNYWQYSFKIAREKDVRYQDGLAIHLLRSSTSNNILTYQPFEITNGSNVSCNRKLTLSPTHQTTNQRTRHAAPPEHVSNPPLRLYLPSSAPRDALPTLLQQSVFLPPPPHCEPDPTPHEKDSAAVAEEQQPVLTHLSEIVGEENLSTGVCWVHCEGGTEGGEGGWVVVEVTVNRWKVLSKVVLFGHLYDMRDRPSFARI